MEVGNYVALSGQLALQRRLETVAHNVANASTPGFRTENVSFASVMSNAGNSNIAYASTGLSTYSKASGPITHTGNPFDIAIQGDGYFGIAVPGGTAYTRDGRMTLSPNGELLTVSGQAVLDQGGASIKLNADRGNLRILRNGVIEQGDQRVATIGLFNSPAEAVRSRYDGASFLSNIPAVPVTDFVASGVSQGVVEGSNANPVLEIAKLMEISRQFEAMSNGIDSSNRRLSDALKTLSGAR